METNTEDVTSHGDIIAGVADVEHEASKYPGSSHSEGEKSPEISLEEVWVLVEKVQALEAERYHETQSAVQRLYSKLSKLVSKVRATERSDLIDSRQSQEHYGHLGTKAQKLLAQQRRCFSLREQAQPMRSQLAYERQEQRKCLRFLLDSVQQALSEPAKTASVPSVSATAQNSNRKLIEEDRENLSNQTQKLETLEQALGGLEFQLQQEEGVLEKQTRDFIEELRAFGVSIPDGPVDAPAPGLGIAGGSPVIEPVLQNFYDNLGHAKVLHGRLLEFEEEYDEARSRIIFDEEQERVPEITLDEFQEQSSKRRRELQQELDQACEMAEAAKMACVDAGLDPEAYKMDIPDYSDVNMPQSPDRDAVADNGSDNTQGSLETET